MQTWEAIGMAIIILLAFVPVIRAEYFNNGGTK
jgi:hypothetical protein